MQRVRRDNKGHRDVQATRAVLPVVREEDGVMMGISLFIVGFVVGAVTIIVLAVLVAGD